MAHDERFTVGEQVGEQHEIKEIDYAVRVEVGTRAVIRRRRRAEETVREQYEISEIHKLVTGNVSTGIGAFNDGTVTVVRVRIAVAIVVHIVVTTLFQAGFVRSSPFQ